MLRLELLSLALLFSTAISALSFPSLSHRAAVAASIEKRATTTPKYVIYSDKWVNYGAPPPASSLNGWNVFAISFWMSQANAQDMAQGWQLLTASQRAGVKQDYAAAGIKLIVTAFGATDTPTSSGADPTLTAVNLANWVKTYSIDGVDVDYEDFYAFNGGTAEAWLITFTTKLRSLLPSSSGYIITHAPVAPWFTNVKSYYPAGGYLYIDQQVGSMIDWYNIQFYNQGVNEYVDCNTLLHQSSSFPGASLFEIAASGVPLNKLVIGKPGSTADASNGYMTSQQLAVCVAQAKQAGWNAGLSVWQYPNQAPDYIQVAWGNAATTGTYTQSSITSTITPVTPTSATGATASAVTTGSSSSNTNCYPVTNAQTCGPSAGTRCGAGYCCSSSGYCGGGGISSNDAWCGSGCQSGFGTCYGVAPGTCPASSASATSTVSATSSTLTKTTSSTTSTPVITSSASSSSSSSKPTSSSTSSSTKISSSVMLTSTTTSVTRTTTITPGATSSSKSPSTSISSSKSTSSSKSSTAASAPTSATNCKLAVSTNGSCGGTTGLRCGAGYCCSGSGYCGNNGGGASDPWCGAGCQNTFGTCFGAPASTC